MLRYFSRMLIFTLLLTSPLSFTGDKCPDFAPVFEVREVCAQLEATKTVFPRAVVTPQSAISVGTSPLSLPIAIAPDTTCDIHTHHSPHHDRAPPNTCRHIS